MIMAQNGRPTVPRAAMGADQRRRIDLEPALRFVRDIGGGQYRGDPVAPAQQKTANLPFRTGLRRVEHMVEKLS